MANKASPFPMSESCFIFRSGRGRE